MVFRFLLFVRVCQIFRCNNEGDHQTSCPLGSFLSHMSKVVVPNAYCTAVPLLKVPMIKPLPTVNLSESDCEILRRWISAYGVAIQQRTVRQETTTSKHGTLPDFVYQYQRQLAVHRKGYFELSIRRKRRCERRP